MSHRQHSQITDVALHSQKSATAVTPPIEIWQFLDGKAGHRNQVLGLSQALAKRTSVVCHDVDVSSSLKGFRSLIPGRLNSLGTLPPPALLIGAGHATHIPLLAARRKYGGRTVVLMKPSLPLSLFDLCLIPEADGVRRLRENVILTEGAINRIQPSERLDKKRGLILIGGPSQHFGWSNSDVLRQIGTVIQQSLDVEWTLTTSRRTPAAFLDAWRASGYRGQMVPVEQTNADWLPSQLESSATVWVTNESVSMICEALTSGAAVGILRLPISRESRVTRGIDSLMRRRLVTPFERWEQAPPLPVSPQAFNESSRCADLLMERLVSMPTPAEADRHRAA